jgi:UDP-2-acetamido-3-amino-2,3-dideoxy-glucuronate N-acetyltransferase
MVGVPAKQIGWVSRAGNTLNFNDSNEATDEYDNSKYKIVNNSLEVIECK